MLNVVFGREPFEEWVDFIPDARIYFSQHKRPEWFEDPFVKKFLAFIDGTEVLFEEALKDKFGHGISTEMISTGCKTLCCIYLGERDKVFYGTTMGENCYPFLLELARERDITIVSEHYPLIEDKYFDEGLIRIDGKPITITEFEDAFCDWMEERGILA